MGKMKNLLIDQINNQENMPDDTDWDAPTFDGAGFTEADRHELSPAPEEIDLETGKSMWRINEVRIWADTYHKALIMYNEITNWTNPDYETD